MPCYHPITAFRVQEKTTTGKLKIVFSTSGYLTWTEIRVPCSQCLGCRLEKSRQWAVRCLHESTLYEENSFITLTYSDEKLPHDLSLNPDHFQKFMKRLREKYESKKIRFYHSGEYGEATPENDFIARPHYHALIFNHDFSDKKIHSEREGIVLYTSDSLDALWTHGFTTTGEVSFESAAYCARYIMKKINGRQREDGHYLRTSEITGEIYEIEPEYARMSLKPGVGGKWYEKFKSDCYPTDTIHVRGVKQRPPEYYDYLLNLDSPSDYESIKFDRKQNMRRNYKNNTPERLAVRETVKIAQTTQLKRKLR